MGDHDDLLRRHQPGLKYDSMEQYFCDSAAEWTDNPGNELRRADTAHALGDLLASGADARRSTFLGGHALRRRPGGARRRPHRRPQEELPRAVRRAARRTTRPAQPHVRPRRRGRRAPVAAVLVLLLLQRLQPGARDRPARGRLGDDPAAHARRRARPRRLRPAPPGREAPVGAGDARSPATPTGRWSTSPAARTPPTSSPASTRPRRGTTSPTASATRRARRWRSSPTTSRRGSRGRACGATRRARVGGIDQPSPRGPSAHAAVDEPRRRAGHRVGAPAQGRRSPRPRSIIAARARPHARRLRLHPPAPDPPAASLQVTVNSRDEAGVPPRTYTFQVAQTRRGTLVDRRRRSTPPSTTTSTRARPAATRRSRRSRRSPSSTRRARWRKLPLAERAIGGFGRLVARVRGQLGR